MPICTTSTKNIHVFVFKKDKFLNAQGEVDNTIICAAEMSKFKKPFFCLTNFV